MENKNSIEFTCHASFQIFSKGNEAAAAPAALPKCELLRRKAYELCLF